MKASNLLNIFAVTLLVSVPVLLAGTTIQFGNISFSASIYTPLKKFAQPRTFRRKPAFTEIAYQRSSLAEAGLSRDAFDMAMTGFTKLMEKGRLSKDSVITIIDYSKPSSEKRLYVVDLRSCSILYHTHVTHGRQSGLDYPRYFSNRDESNKSSLGFYLTLDTYLGTNGYSLKLMGLEKGINDMAYTRKIVFHGSQYAEEKYMRATGHLGRSLGCPAVPMREHREIIETIKNGNCVFVYYPEKKYLKKSKFLNG